MLDPSRPIMFHILFKNLNNSEHIRQLRTSQLLRSVYTEIFSKFSNLSKGPFHRLAFLKMVSMNKARWGHKSIGLKSKKNHHRICTGLLNFFSNLHCKFVPIHIFTKWQLCSVNTSHTNPLSALQYILLILWSITLFVIFSKQKVFCTIPV